MVYVPGLCLCLPGWTMVTTKTGQKKILQLKHNDLVQTLNGRGQNKWTRFYTWGHRQSDQFAEFLVFQVNNGKQLAISSEHLVFVASGDDDKKKIARKAGQVCVGEKLYHVTEGKMELLPISEIRSEKFLGIYSPFTMSGHFLANGFLVGCYANIADFDLAHAAFAPLRALYKIRAAKTSTKGNKEGIHGYARNLMKFRDLLPLKIQKLVT